ncbi:MAG: phosphotransferase family protein [Desulfobacterales bacterium]|jgi:aminoglycoside phosphotransferase (APT) family kinase protein|nr:phosphotransferase family protein [Desulfobacterales bacterium]
MAILDEPTIIREGEELDLAKVEAFLKEKLEGASGPLEIMQFPSGFSNLTYMIRLGEKEMVLRRPPFGKKARTAHDMKREYTILSALYPVFPYCPKPLAYTDDETVMGCQFYVMERIPGIILRKDLPAGMNLPAADARQLCVNMIDLHHRLHSLDYRAIGLSDFGKPEGYVRRQVDGWSKRYRDARTPDVPDFETVMAWLDRYCPPDSNRPGIIHNDYKFDNLVLNPRNPLEIIGILDWEMATIGDPLMDLGSSLAYWTNRDDPQEAQLLRMMPSTIDGMMTRKELVALYAEKSGQKIESFDFYYCFGLFRLAVIAQQIYYRFYHGQTKDKRFIQLGFAVGLLEIAAKRVIEGGGI